MYIRTYVRTYVYTYVLTYVRIYVRADTRMYCSRSPSPLSPWPPTAGNQTHLQAPETQTHSYRAQLGPRTNGQPGKRNESPALLHMTAPSKAHNVGFSFILTTPPSHAFAQASATFAFSNRPCGKTTLTTRILLCAPAPEESLTSPGAAPGNHKPPPGESQPDPGETQTHIQTNSS